jgi:predicted RNA-binding protein with EMAP domain
MNSRRRRQGVIAALVALGASLLFFTGCGELNRGELNRGVESLSALAAQGELVANGVARDATKSTYVRVMAKTLGGEAEHEAEKLADAEPEAGAEGERKAAVQLAGELADLFSELQTFPGDEHRGAEVEKEMGELKDQADGLVEGLTGEKA